ncbi:NapC/NirT family cytochrome c [Dethiobacter alkaliphilus]|uniref:Cytochrome c, NapC/NirT family n=1 Tax=Dethiobacter alkaliphilus AHT 1 TaxID=555088 RepID=C0GG37_DETAL|nr:NapC/NirT family cytochrome c [Dethiobacter alkaliphilus]EEG77726.1 cytochrome c, NapC/NirT family [Dethiobacter alkaliphilus AHT 1]
MSYNNAYWVKRKRKYKFFTFILLLFLTTLVFYTDIDQNSGAFCTQCHAMQPQKLTWQASSHENTGCAKCHVEEGLDGTIELFQDLARYAYREATNTYMNPIRLFTRVEDDQCLICHNTDREVSSMGDIYIPHQLHYDSRVSCEACHKSVAHGGIARRGETRAGSTWDEERAARAMAWENTAAPMDDCMQCHFRRRASVECAACHTGLNLPGYHQFADFNWNHGAAVRNDLEGCNICHGYAGTRLMEVDENTSIKRYARENTFCVDCHRQTPPSHETRWTVRHGDYATSGSGQEGCMVCHDNRDTGEIRVTRSSCGQCHPSPHTPGFQNKHYPDLTASSRPTQSCYMCHSANNCTSCHREN